jgi:hypothetical protein
MNLLTTMIKIFLNLPFLPPSIFMYSSNLRVLQQNHKNILTRLSYIFTEIMISLRGCGFHLIT